MEKWDEKIDKTVEARRKALLDKLRRRNGQLRRLVERCSGKVSGLGGVDGVMTRREIR